MNCFNHNKKVAVGACQNCNIGLCNDCVTNALIISLCLWKFFMGFFHLGFLGAFWLGLKEVKILTIVPQE
ncbi:hypothetical protein [Campylobacter upsaliensis]|uniref:hypothetical protein n=1 Tax=Campylobacter upsaliensis TaxID=28080 RepID=UPI00214A6FB9|nr:hypothetical protein [Campylobacter upsaliensis]MCR2112275.1 hypothetical protein [Campylobacter upsaliensis]